MVRACVRACARACVRACIRPSIPLSEQRMCVYIYYICSQDLRVELSWTVNTDASIGPTVGRGSSIASM